MIYNGVQHFVKYYPRFHLPMATFEQWLLDAVHALHRQFSESLLTVDAHVSYVLDSLTQDLKDRCMQLVPGRQRQVLLLFLVMPLKRELSSTSEAEWSTFISDMENEHANVPSDRPPWINYQVCCICNFCRHSLEVDWNAAKTYPPPLESGKKYLLSITIQGTSYPKLNPAAPPIRK